MGLYATVPSAYHGETADTDTAATATETSMDEIMMKITSVEEVGRTEGYKIGCRNCGTLCFQFVRDVNPGDRILPADLISIDNRLPDTGIMEVGEDIPDCPECSTPLIWT